MSSYLVLWVGSCVHRSVPITNPPPAPTPPVPVAAAVPAIPPLPALDALGERDPDCMIEEVLAPILRPLQEGVPVAVTAELGRTAEAFTLPDGTPVRFQRGGCVHFGMMWTFGLAAAPADPYAEAIRLMERVGFVGGTDDVKSRMIAAGALDEHGYFPCGDATCRVDVFSDAAGVRLVVGYDFPL